VVMVVVAVAEVAVAAPVDVAVDICRSATLT
jgi:hypothetical protein